MASDILWIVILTLAPFLELRASIIYGIGKTDLHFMTVFLVAVISNIILGTVLYLLIDKIVHIGRKVAFVDRIYQRYVEKTQTKVQRYVDKYGEYGVALFIGVPLPGSGSYSGALGSYLLGLPFKQFFIANLIGVLIAGTIMTITVITGAEALSIFLT